jgi:hypothetical protein
MFNIPGPTSQKIHLVTVTNIIQLIRITDIINFHPENGVLNTCKMCGQNAQFLNDEVDGTSQSKYSFNLSYSKR